MFPAFYILKILDNSTLSLNTSCSFIIVLQIGALEQSTLLKKIFRSKKEISREHILMAKIQGWKWQCWLLTLSFTLTVGKWEQAKVLILGVVQCSLVKIFAIHDRKSCPYDLFSWFMCMNRLRIIFIGSSVCSMQAIAIILQKLIQTLKKRS